MIGSWFSRLQERWRSNETTNSVITGTVQSKDDTAADKFIPRRPDALSALLAAHIPIVIPVFDNLTYASLMVSQLRLYDFRNIILWDNGSSYPPFLEYLRASSSAGLEVIRDRSNRGPRFAFEDAAIYATLPEIFCITDPDLMFGNATPIDFVEQLVKISNDFKIGKVGLAIDISEPDQMIEKKIINNGISYHVWEWEKQFWQERVGFTEGGDEIYQAAIDTTFAIYNKRYFVRDNPLHALRVAGRFTCKHLPWCKDNLMPPEEELCYSEGARYSYTFGKNRSELS